MKSENLLEVFVRDLTIANSVSDVSSDIMINLPDCNLEDKLNKEHEYIIVDSELDLDEFENIFEFNNWLIETDCSLSDLKILTKTYLLKETKEKIEKGDYCIYCFDDDTSNWNCGYGVPQNEWWKGYYLHEKCGFIFDWEKLSHTEEALHGNFFREKLKEIVDYINYEYLYTSMLTQGLREVRYKDKLYFIV